MSRLAVLVLALSLLAAGVRVPSAHAQQAGPDPVPVAPATGSPEAAGSLPPDQPATEATPEATGESSQPPTPGSAENAENAEPSEAAQPSGPAEPAEPEARSVDAHYRLGMKALRAHDTARAERHFEAVLRIAPYHFLTHMALGRLYLARQPAKARDHLETARRIHPSSVDVHYLLGQAYEALGRYLEAAEAYRHAIYLNPRHYNANARLRGVLRRMRAGRTVLERAAESFYAKPSVASLTLYGRIVMRHAKPREAVLEFEEVRRRLPDLPEAELWLARAYTAAGDESSALDAYRRYLAVRPEATGVRLLLVERLSAQGWYQDAADALAPLRTAAAGNDGRTPPHLAPSTRARVTFLRSRLMSAQGHPVQAAKLLLEAHDQGHPAKAIDQAFGEDLALFPRKGGLWLVYSRWLAQDGQPAKSAEALGEAGRLDPAVRPEAVERLQALLGDKRARVAAALSLGELEWADGKADAALAALRAVPPGHRLDHRAALLRGLIHRSRGELGPAMDAFMRYVFFFDNRADMLYARGNLFWQQGRREEALALWKRDPDVLLHHPGLLLNVAEYQREQGDTAGEMATRERLAQAVPGNDDNRIRLGQLYERAGRTSEAVLLWDRVLKDRPRDTTLLLKAGKGWLALGDKPRGLRLLRRASQLGALDLDTTLLVARELYAMQQFEEALSVYWRIYQEHPDQPDLPRVLPELALNLPVTAEQRRAAVELARKDGRNAVATELLEATLAEHPDDAETRMSLAELYLVQNKVREAEAVLMNAQAGPADRERGLTLLARAQTRLGRTEALVGTLARLQALRPDDGELLRRRALLLARLHRPADARPLLESVLQAAPGDTPVREALAGMLMAQGQTDAAIGHLEIVLGQQPGNTGARRRLIDLLLRAKRWDEAAAQLEQWVAAHPDDLNARYNLVTAYLARFRKDEARPHFEVLRDRNDRRAKQLAPYFR